MLPPLPSLMLCPVKFTVLLPLPAFLSANARVAAVTVSPAVGTFSHSVTMVESDALNPVIRTAAQMERELDLRPVVSIPEVRPEKAAQRGRGMVKLLDDPTKPLLGLPRYAVISGVATLLLLTAAAVV